MSQTRTSTKHRKAQDFLNAQPSHSVILDCHGMAWQEGGLSLNGWWYRAYGDGEALSSYELAFHHPITVMEKGKTS